MGFFFNYPAVCGICGWDGYEDTVRTHIRKDHPGAEERLKELHKLHKAGTLSHSEMLDLIKKEFK